MPPRGLVFGAIGTALLATVATGSSSYCAHLQPASNLSTAPGIEYRVLVANLSRPRGVIEDSEGNVLLVESRNKGVTRVVLNGGDAHSACAVSKSLLVKDSKLNHGIALSSDGTTLFASSSTDVYAYAYDAVAGTAGPRRHLITGMKQGGHATRTLLVPKLHPNLLLVSRGSDGNVDKGTVHIASGRSQIRVFEIDKLMGYGGPVPYTSGKVLGWGLRNSVGVAQEPITGSIWSVENSLDNMKRGGRDIHNSNPGEELNYHGRPDDKKSGFYGANYGYPACVTIYDSSNVDGYLPGAETGRPFVGDHMPRNWTDGYCQEKTMPPRITFESHLAPLDIEFLDDGSAAYISMHGSWNRQPAAGYRLSRVSFAYGAPLPSPHSQEAEEKVLWNSDGSQCPHACLRPVGVALSSGGDSLYLTSDATGELLLVSGVKNGHGGLQGPPRQESVASK
ncbi:hypothetical protein HIM_00621 [Hirsutella minnesotensis 3608]|nr:hypothetical protein HIM_00621 [Hirsutella minnesotensis 3608]